MPLRCCSTAQLRPKQPKKTHRSSASSVVLQHIPQGSLQPRTLPRRLHCTLAATILPTLWHPIPPPKPLRALPCRNTNILQTMQLWGSYSCHLSLKSTWPTCRCRPRAAASSAYTGRRLSRHWAAHLRTDCGVHTAWGLYCMLYHSNNGLLANNRGTTASKHTRSTNTNVQHKALLTCGSMATAGYACGVAVCALHPLWGPQATAQQLQQQHSKGQQHPATRAAWRVALSAARC